MAGGAAWSQLGWAAWRCLPGDYGLTRTTMTMKPNRCLFQPPSQQTCQSPKREPSVTAVRRRRNLVSYCTCFYGHHIHHSFTRHSQVALPPTCVRSGGQGWNQWTKLGPVATCFRSDKSAYAVAHAQNTFPANTPRAEDWISAGPQRRLRSPPISIHRRCEWGRPTTRKTGRGKWLTRGHHLHAEMAFRSGHSACRIGGPDRNGVRLPA